MICKDCLGSGHDYAGRPVVKFVEFTDENGRARKRHVTLQQGSGCLTCLGRGQV